MAGDMLMSRRFGLSRRQRLADDSRILLYVKLKVWVKASIVKVLMLSSHVHKHIFKGNKLTVNQFQETRSAID